MAKNISKFLHETWYMDHSFQEADCRMMALEVRQGQCLVRYIYNNNSNNNTSMKKLGWVIVKQTLTVFDHWCASQCAVATMTHSTRYI